MASREEAADARTVELIGLIRDGSRAKDAEIAALRAALSNAGADATRQVEEALAADSEFDADRKEAGNTALSELIEVTPGVVLVDGEVMADDEAPTDPGAA